MAGAPHAPAFDSPPVKDEGLEVEGLEVEALLRRFVAASVRGDVAEMLQMLAPDVTLITDGGGKAASATVPISGANQVSQFLGGLARWATAGMYARTFSVNGQPSLALYDADDGLEVILVPVVRDGQVETLFAMRNPDKMRLPQELLRAESEKIPLERL
jgi:RNA polymerase sigma-70 factor (ECF subfamily)